MWILGHFSISLTIAEYGILGDFFAFPLQSLANFTIRGKMTDADKVMN